MNEEQLIAKGLFGVFKLEARAEIFTKYLLVCW
jgi:hypothetical protein